MLLALDGVTKSFSGLTALSEVTFDVGTKAIKGVIGPNGAGKTTLFNVISGLFRPDRGSVAFDGRTITRMKPEGRSRIGIARTFQHPRLFKSLTIWENVMLGLHGRGASEFTVCGLRLPGARREERRIREAAAAQLDQVGLADKRHRMASELSLGEQRYLEIARALAAEPRFLLLDEPAAGLNESEAETFKEMLFGIREGGIAILVIEHHMRFIMTLCDEIVVLNFGRVIAEGPPDQVRRSPQVIEAYLGAEDDDA
jgi:branched-chain amino acid transport system ATP-binding protein